MDDPFRKPRVSGQTSADSHGSRMDVSADSVSPAGTPFMATALRIVFYTRFHCISWMRALSG